MRKLKTIAAALSLTIGASLAAAPSQQVNQEPSKPKIDKAITSQNKKKKTSSVLDPMSPLGFAEYAQRYFNGTTSPIYIPKKHTVQTYRSQQRQAKNRRKKHNKNR